jgi:hypothetical protein
MTKTEPQKTPKELDAIVDVVLTYRPKPKTKPARERQRVRRRLAEKNHDDSCMFSWRISRYFLSDFSLAEASQLEC